MGLLALPICDVDVGLGILSITFIMITENGLWSITGNRNFSDLGMTDGAGAMKLHKSGGCVRFRSAFIMNETNTVAIVVLPDIISPFSMDNVKRDLANQWKNQYLHFRRGGEGMVIGIPHEV